MILLPASDEDLSLAEVEGWVKAKQKQALMLLYHVPRRWRLLYQIN